jgi:hypothetical protein
VWFGATGDLVVLGSGRPLQYDSAWLERLLGRHGALRDLASEYLGVDAPSQYFGRRLLHGGETARLVARATVAHDDDRPELEFVAARRFLDSRVRADVFDSLVALGPGAAVDTASLLRLARVLSGRRWDANRLKYVDAARRVAPGDPFWTIQSAGMRLAEGQPAFADSALPRLVARGDPDALLLSGWSALRHEQIGRARALLERALAAGADSAETYANLAVVAAREDRWTAAVAQASAALATTRGTLRNPQPRGLGDALERLAQRGPPDEVTPLLANALARRPNSPALHEYRAVIALRAGDCATGLNELLELLQFGLERPDGPALVARCRRGETF